MGHFAPQLQPTWESITLARFLRQLPPAIELVHDAGDRPVRWVEPSDMDDPTDYLMADELILTSGFPFLQHVADQEWIDRFIAKLVQAEASALGFGLEPYFSSIPETVRIACARHGLTLLQIPTSVPFAAIGIAFAKLMEADGAAQLRSNAEANRALMRCISHPDPERQLVDTLSQRLKGSVRLTNASGQTRFNTTIASIAALDTATEAQMIQDAFQAIGPQPFAMHRQDAQVHLTFPIRAAFSPSGQSPLLGALSVGFSRTPSAFDHHLITSALGLLEVLARERAASSAASSQLATSLLFRSHTALDSETLNYLTESIGSNTNQVLRVAVISPLGTARTTETNFHLAHVHALFDTRLAMRRDDHLIALTSAEPTTDLFERLKSNGYLAAFSTPAKLESQLGERLGELLAQASGLLPQMLERQQCLDAASIPRAFASLLPAQAGRQLAEEELAKILELPEARRDLYLDVLHGWLEANGSWDQASKNINLHRNSVRRHIATIAEILGKDLNQAQVRHDLYLALKFLTAT
ncbi:PucR family transcriptional regulator [Arthrobacter sp. MYb213]|uniref:PucR family transcriptional regulator n=1 Tax=Arthrobacter sp. MYb213 TaxID=1848595 RepID=UPI000CFC103C|nr:PucR family transcriptional regulator [Arthrobacter sp. MYb213]PRB66501.1 hypothetical protein CQ011_17620 [Arthrobacter sp. MYb213]